MGWNYKINTKIPKDYKINTKINIGRRALYSEEDIAQMNDDISHGASRAQISRAYNISQSLLNYYMKTKRILPTKRKFNKESLLKIKELRSKNISYEKIARQLNISVSYLFKLKKGGRLK